MRSMRHFPAGRAPASLRFSLLGLFCLMAVPHFTPLTSHGDEQQAAPQQAAPQEAAPQDTAPGYRRARLTGDQLHGWRVSGCEVELKDGVLLLKSGNGLVRSDHRYGDFELELSWRALGTERWDSGIYFRCEAPPPGRPWPSRYQVNLLRGQEGQVGGLKETRTEGLVRDGQWNRFKLRVVGNTASLEINGQPAWTTDGIEAPSGYVALQAEVPGGGQFEFKDIFITELGYRPLFNGRDLTGWEGAGRDAAECWKVDDQLLMCTGEKGPWLRSTEQFGDFNLRLDYRLKEGGNSGVYTRVPMDGDHHGEGAGVEIQILDDAAERYKSLKPYQYCGSVYAIAPATPRVGLPAGQWNTLEINCQGHAYRVTHNGVVVVDATPDSFPELRQRRLEGFIGLQNHSEAVWFRHLRVGPPQR